MWSWLGIIGLLGFRVVTSFDLPFEGSPGIPSSWQQGHEEECRIRGLITSSWPTPFGWYLDELDSDSPNYFFKKPLKNFTRRADPKPKRRHIDPEYIRTVPPPLSAIGFISTPKHLDSYLATCVFISRRLALAGSGFYGTDIINSYINGTFKNIVITYQHATGAHIQIGVTKVYIHPNPEYRVALLKTVSEIPLSGSFEPLYPSMWLYTTFARAANLGCSTFTCGFDIADSNTLHNHKTDLKCIFYTNTLNPVGIQRKNSIEGKLQGNLFQSGSESERYIRNSRAYLISMSTTPEQFNTWAFNGSVPEKIRGSCQTDQGSPIFFWDKRYLNGKLDYRPENIYLIGITTGAWNNGECNTGPDVAINMLVLAEWLMEFMPGIPDPARPKTRPSNPVDSSWWGYLFPEWTFQMCKGERKDYIDAGGKPL